MISLGRVAMCTGIGYFRILQIALRMPRMSPLTDKTGIRRNNKLLQTLTGAECSLRIFLGSSRCSKNVQTIISMSGRQLQSPSGTCHTILLFFRFQTERNAIDGQFRRKQLCSV